MKVEGSKLAAARERVFMSQDELAESIGMNPVVVMRPSVFSAFSLTSPREGLRGEKLCSAPGETWKSFVLPTCRT